MKETVYPLPVDTDKINIKTQSKVFDSFIQTRSKYSTEQNLVTWKQYYYACKTLYRSVKALTQNKRNELVEILPEHKFMWQIRKDQVWYEIDFGFEYICCLLAGCIWLTDSTLSNTQELPLFEEIVEELYTMEKDVCGVRNAIFPTVTQSKTLVALSAPYFLIKQLAEIFEILSDLEICTPYDEQEFMEQVSLVFDVLVEYFMGLQDIVEMVQSARKRVLDYKIHYPDSFYDFLWCKVEEAKVDFSLMCFFVASIDRSNQIDKISTVIATFLKVFQSGIEPYDITKKLYDIAEIHEQTVQVRNKNIEYKLIEKTGAAIGVPDLESYIVKEKLNPALAVFVSE